MSIHNHENYCKNHSNTLAPSFLIGSSSFFAGNKDNLKNWMSSKFGQIGLRTAELAALDHLEKSP